MDHPFKIKHAIRCTMKKIMFPFRRLRRENERKFRIYADIKLLTILTFSHKTLIHPSIFSSNCYSVVILSCVLCSPFSLTAFKIYATRETFRLFLTELLPKDFLIFIRSIHFSILYFTFSIRSRCLCKIKAAKSVRVPKIQSVFTFHNEYFYKY